MAMTYNIISAEEVIALAFSDGGYIAAEAIAETDIAASVRRWIQPITGEPLLKALTEGNYSELLEAYIKPAAAACVRVDMQPRLNGSTGQMGLAVVTATGHSAADSRVRHDLNNALKRRATELRKILSEYLDAHPEISEYSPRNNILKRCRCDGGIVQIH